jgi:hypothetical protein
MWQTAGQPRNHAGRRFGRSFAHNEAVTTLSAHDVTKTYDCKTPGCDGEARTKTGRHAYCTPIARCAAMPHPERESRAASASRPRLHRPAPPLSRMRSRSSSEQRTASISSYMVHSSIKITLDRYGHLMPGNEDAAAELLDAYLARADTAARLAQIDATA